MMAHSISYNDNLTLLKMYVTVVTLLNYIYQKNDRMIRTSQLVPFVHTHPLVYMDLSYNKLNKKTPTFFLSRKTYTVLVPVGKY